MKREDLGAGISVFTDSVHKFGTDAILLAHFAKASQVSSACDLGTGCGIIPFLWCKEEGPKSIMAVDIQESAIALVESGIAENGLTGRVTAVLKDLKELPGANFDLVTMNPPYKTVNGGIQSGNESKDMARFEIKCDLKDICGAAARLLKPAGRFCMCHRPERLTDAMVCLRKQALEPKRLRLVCQTAERAPSLILIEAKKGGNAGLTIEPNLVIESCGGYTAELREIYKGWEQSNG